MSLTPYASEMPVDWLPPSLRELVAVIGLDATLRIVEQRGGVRLVVPSRARPGHWLAELIGLEALERLVDVYGREEIDIPRCAGALRAIRARQIAAEHAAGVSNAQLARRYGYTERGIRKLRRRIESASSDQCDLFDDDPI